MLKKILASVSAAAMIAGASHALVVNNVSAGRAGAVDGNPTLLAAELDYAGGAVVSVAGETVVEFYPTAGLFPTGNVLVHVTVSGGVFSAVLDGSELVGTGTSVISSGGQLGANEVVFLVSGAELCTGPGDCTIDLPIELDGSDVSFAVGLQTDAGAPVDNSSAANRVTEGVVQIAAAWDIDFTPDTVASTATLASLYTALTDGDLGDISVAANQVTIGAVARTVSVDLAGNAVSTADVDGAGGSVNVVVSGFMDAFNPAALPAGGDFTIGGTSATVSNAADTATRNVAATGTFAVIATADTETVIPRSDYTAVVTITPETASPLVASTTASGALQSINRDGTSIVFPWTQTATQGAASGATSVFRIGNLDDVDAGAVFVEVKSSADGAVGYTNPGIKQLATSIDANGEFVTTSADLEAELGNYGRGDIEFSVEADPETLTGRQFVVRGGVIQQVSGGTIEQDLN